MIAFWSHIDANLATILSKMLKADIAAGAAMYEALTGGDARRAAAKQALPLWAEMLLKAVFSATKGSRTQRNDFAHHVWAITDELPDALLSMPPGVVTRHNISFRQVHNVDGANVIRPEPIDYTQIMVYRDIDFTRAVDEAAESDLQYILFYDAISALPLLGYGIGRRLLLKKPQIQQAIAKMTHESRQPVPPELLPEANVDPLEK